MSHNNKQKFALWVHPETLSRVSKHYRNDNCKSQSEFIEKSIEFYLGFLESKINMTFLTDVIAQTVEGVIGHTEKRIRSLQFKNTVAQLVVAKTLAQFIELDDEQKRKIHLEAVNEVKNL